MDVHAMVVCLESCSWLSINEVKIYECHNLQSRL